METIIQYLNSDQLEIFVDPDYTIVYNHETGKNEYVQNSTIGTKRFFDPSEWIIERYGYTGIEEITGSSGPTCPSVLSCLSGPSGPTCPSVLSCLSGPSGPSGPNCSTEHTYSTDRLNGKGKTYRPTGHVHDKIFEFTFLTAEDLPKLFHMKIKLTSDVKDPMKTYEDISRILQNFGDGYIEISEKPQTKIVPDYTRIKDEYRTDVVKMSDRNVMIERKYNDSINTLKSLGIHVGSIKDPKYEKIPVDFYMEKEYVDSSKVFFNIYCHSKTKIYEALVGSGLLMRSLTTFQIYLMKKRKYQLQQYGTTCV